VPFQKRFATASTSAGVPSGIFRIGILFGFLAPVRARFLGLATLFTDGGEVFAEFLHRDEKAPVR
jgi:hypothetical protein